MSSQARRSMGYTADSSRNHFEREIQYFGFHPVQFIDDLVNAINDYACNSADALEESLRAKIDGGRGAAEQEEALQEGTAKVLKQLQQAIDKNYDLWELYVLKNIFVVPPEFSSKSSSDKTEQQQHKALMQTEEAILDRNIEDLKSRILAVHYMNDALLKGNEALGKENERLEQHVHLLERLSSQCEATLSQSGTGLSRLAPTLEHLVQGRALLMGLINEAQDLDAALSLGQ